MKDTQEITRKDLILIYKDPSICSGWKTTIGELLINQEGSKIKVENSLVESAYKAADTSQKKLVKKYFEVQSSSIIDKIKDFNDILKLSGKKIQDVLPFKKPVNKAQVSLNAVAKIQLITEVYNQGVILDFRKTNQYKYYPYFIKKARGGWCLGDSDYVAVVAGLGFGFYFDTSEKALDAGNKFLDIYKEYLPE